MVHGQPHRPKDWDDHWDHLDDRLPWSTVVVVLGSVLALLYLAWTGGWR